MSRIKDTSNLRERTNSAFSGIRITPFEELSARTHEKVMSIVCINNPSADKGNKATVIRGHQIISKHRKSRFYLYSALTKGEHK
jgi:hypothetical protein